MARNRLSFLSLLGGLSPEQLQGKPVSGGWSALETLEHVGRTEGFVVAVLRSPPAIAPPMVGGVVPRMIRRLPVPWRLAILSRRMGRATAPRNVVPHPGTPPDSVFALAREARAGLEAFVDQADPKQLAGTQLQHPVLGLFDGFDWIDFLAAHEERHLRQARAQLRPHG